MNVCQSLIGTPKHPCVPVKTEKPTRSRDSKHLKGKEKSTILQEIWLYLQNIWKCTPWKLIPLPPVTKHKRIENCRIYKWKKKHLPGQPKQFLKIKNRFTLEWFLTLVHQHNDSGLEQYHPFSMTWLLTLVIFMRLLRYSLLLDDGSITSSANRTLFLSWHDLLDPVNCKQR